MDVVGMSLAEIAAQEGSRGRRRRGRGFKRNGGVVPVTSTQQRRKSSDKQKERSQKQRDDRKSRRLFQDLEKPQYASVVFGNSTPEKVLTGRLNESQIPKRGKEQPAAEPVSLVQAALERGRKVFLESQARDRNKKDQARDRNKKDAGGKRQTATREQRKRPILQHPLSRKLHIVRPGDPGYKRQLHMLRNRSLGVRLVNNGEKQQRTKQQDQQTARQRPQRATTRPVQRDSPAKRVLDRKTRRIILGMSKDSSSPAGTLSERFSSLK